MYLGALKFSASSFPGKGSGWGDVDELKEAKLSSSTTQVRLKFPPIIDYEKWGGAMLKMTSLYVTCAANHSDATIAFSFA